MPKDSELRFYGMTDLKRESDTSEILCYNDKVEFSICGDVLASLLTNTILMAMKRNA